jgi:hypothetical protein
MRRFAAAPIVLALARPALAADLPEGGDQVFPCRPTVSCTAEIASPGTLEVEAGFQFSRIGTAGWWTYPVLLKQTFTKWLQLQVGSNGYTTILDPPAPAVQYLDNVVVGPKFHVLDQGKIAPSISITAQVGIPTFDRPGYVRAYDAFLTAHVSKDIGPVHVDWNGAGYLWRIGPSPLLQGFTALAASVNLVDPFGAAVEVYGLSNAAPLEIRDGGVRFVVTATPRPWLVFDFGADPGFFQALRSYTLFVGMTIVPVMFWRSS